MVNNYNRKMMLSASCLLLALMSACSSGSGNGNGGQAGGATNAPAASPAPSGPAENAAAEEPSGTAEMDFDMGGRTIKWASWYDESIKEDNPDNIERKKKLDELMAKHNFKIEYVTVDYGEYSNKVTASLLAGEPIGDIVRVARPWMIPTLVQQELFTPVDEYTKNESVFLPQYTNVYSSFEGRGYGFRAGGAGAAGGIFYNRTLMNKLGLKPLQEYVDEDNWNWDTFIDVAKQGNKDTNNDGKLDTWGLASASMVIQALAANEANLVIDDKQNLEDPKSKETFDFISKLVTEKVPRPTEGGDWTEPGQFFRQGNTLMVAGADYEMDGFKKDMTDDIGFLPFPKGPSATAYHSHLTIPNYLTIPSGVEHPEQLVYLYEKMNDIDSVYDYPKQSSLETWFSSEDDINNAKIAGESINVVDGKDGYPSMPYYEFVDELMQGVSVSTAIEKYKEPFQAAINEVWKK
ncbi:ABC transporter substrate-binding protein [Paenibacillus pasadenensis]|uniref:N-Acetyl-D-glucosamine ABC transport system, sugar-binding protein n=1 Tax=Paenibacillus pasadenensis TaxID=217090 RepID=A0A2N5N6F6_9BACL|nr:MULTISPECIES: extracellular solute-binding protein [Paenibacillus]PLT45890.1 N-Acetyl-D-glucosamine ABC transport system, sugar-binding protein [Paenibacillus pasadenensis]